MSGVIVPGYREKKDPLDTVMKGLAIARDIYGIKTAMDEADVRKEDQAYKAQQRSDENAGVLSKKEMIGLGDRYNVVDQSMPGAQKVGVREGDTVKDLFIMPREKSPTGQWVKTMDAQGKPLLEYVQGARAGETRPAYVPPTKPEKQDVIAIETVDEKGNPVTRLVPKTAGATYDKPKKPVSADETFAKLSKPDQITVTTLTEQNAKKTSAISQLEQQLANFRKSYEDGDEDLAAQQGGEMLKILNSDVGADAVGAEESKRLGAFLEYKVANFTGPGSFIGRDLDKFFEQAAQKTNSMKGAIEANDKIVADILAGKGRGQFQLTDSKLGPKGGDGTARASGGKGGAAPGTIVRVGGQQFTVGADGDTLLPMPQASGGR